MTARQGGQVARATLSSITLAAAMLIPSFASAAIKTWDGSASGYWNNGANWSGASVPSNGDDLVFPAGAAHLVNTNNLVDRRFRSITLAGSGYLLRGNSLVLSNGLTAQHATGSTTVDLDIELGAPQTFECTMSAADCYVTGNLNLGSYDLTSQGAGEVRLGGAISGTGGLIKNGTGTLWLYGSVPNNYTGDTRVNNGMLMLAKTGGSAVAHGELIVGDGLGAADADVVREQGAFQIGSIPVTVASSGWLDLDDYNDTIGSLTLESGGHVSTVIGTLTLGGYVAVLGTGTATIEGQLSLGGVTRVFDVPSGAALRVDATISGSGGITKTNSGFLALRGANTFAGLTTIQGGYVEVYHAQGLGQATNGTVLQSGRLRLVGTAIADESLQVDGGWLQAINASNAWTGPITLNANLTVDVPNAGQVLALDTSIEGSGGLRKIGGGTLMLSGADYNTYSGDTVVNAGVLLLNKTPNRDAVPGDLIIGDGLGGEDADVVRSLANYQMPDLTDITLNSSGLLDLNGFRDSVGGLEFFGGDIDTGAGTLVPRGDISINSTTNIATVHGHLEISGTRRFNFTAPETLQMYAQVVGTGSLVKDGEGTLNLYASNTFAGTFTINGGEVTVDDNHGLGSTSGGTILNGGILELINVTITNETLTVNSPSELEGYQTNRWSGDIALNATLSVWPYSPTPSRLELSGAISGTGGITKIAEYEEGVLALTGSTANTYSGPTIINAGVLELNKIVTDGAIQGALIIGDDIGGPGADVVHRVGGLSQISDLSRVTVNSSGLLDLRPAAGDGFEQIGSLEGSGQVELASSGLGVGYDNTSFTFSGTINGSLVLGVHKHGAGTFTLAGTNTYNGPTFVHNGTLLVNGSQPQSPVSVTYGTTIGGIGSVGNITNSGTIASGGSPGRLTSNNALFDHWATFKVELTPAACDDLDVHGEVNLGDASLVVSAAGLLPIEGEEFCILHNDGTDPVLGTFAGLSEGALVWVGPRRFRITYTGGSGNDVVLIATNTAALLPTLSVQQTGTNTAVVSWRQSDIPWLLHTTTNPASASVWDELPPPYTSNATEVLFIEPAGDAARFYRLHNP